MHGQLYRRHTNAMALFSGPVVSALGSELDNPGFSPGWGKALCPWDVQERKMQALLLGLAKSIYYETPFDFRSVVRMNHFWIFLWMWNKILQ